MTPVGGDRLLEHAADGDEQHDRQGHDPQQRPPAAVDALPPRPPPGRDRLARPAPRPPVQPPGEEQEGERDGQRQRVRERAHEQEEGEQGQAAARALLDRPPAQDERERQRHVAPGLVEVGVHAGVEDDPVQAHHRHRARARVDAGPEQLARDQVPARRRHGQDHRRDHRDGLERVEVGQAGHAGQRVVDGLLGAPDQRHLVDGLVDVDRGRIVVLQEMRRAHGQVGVRAVADHGREAGAEHRDERDEHQQQRQVEGPAHRRGPRR